MEFLYKIVVITFLVVFYLLPLVRFVNFKFNVFTGIVLFIFLFSGSVLPIDSYNISLTIIAILIAHSLYKKSMPYELEDNIYNFSFKKLLSALPFILIAKLITMLALDWTLRGLEFFNIQDTQQQIATEITDKSNDFTTLIILFISACIVAPLTEEYAIRYVLYGEILKNKFNLNVYLSAIISALIFALMHDSLGAIINAFLAGLVLTWVYQKYGLWYSIATHFIFNLLAFIGLLINS